MNNGLGIALLVVVAVVVIAVLVTRSRRANDGVDSFRRQIDALSPEARRPVIDQVQNAAGRIPRGDHDDLDDEDRGDLDPDDGRDDGPDGEPEGGLRGT